MLVYRGMDVGTGKPTAEQRAAVPHHLLDLAEPSERFTVARFQELARGVLRSIAHPLLVGGSGLYLRAVVDDLAFPPEDPVVRASLEAEADDLGAEALYHRLAEMDPVAAARIEPGNVRRIIRALEVTAISGAPFSSFAASWDRYDADRVRPAGIRLDREAQRERIAERVLAMLENGWLDEVQALMDRGFGAWLTASQAIGYAELAEHLDGRLSLDEAAERTVKRTRELARRQMAWFRRDPRIRWFDAGVGGAPEVADDIRAYLGSA
jgi:tRNA dimethylallyltransferase